MASRLSVNKSQQINLPMDMSVSAVKSMTSSAVDPITEEERNSFTTSVGDAEDLLSAIIEEEGGMETVTKISMDRNTPSISVYSKVSRNDDEEPGSYNSDEMRQSRMSTKKNPSSNFKSASRMSKMSTRSRNMSMSRTNNAAPSATKQSVLSMQQSRMSARPSQLSNRQVSKISQKNPSRMSSVFAPQKSNASKISTRNLRSQRFDDEDLYDDFREEPIAPSRISQLNKSRSKRLNSTVSTKSAMSQREPSRLTQREPSKLTQKEPSRISQKFSRMGDIIEEDDIFDDDLYDIPMISRASQVQSRSRTSRMSRMLPEEDVDDFEDVCKCRTIKGYCCIPIEQPFNACCSSFDPCSLNRGCCCCPLPPPPPKCQCCRKQTAARMSCPRIKCCSGLRFAIVARK